MTNHEPREQAGPELGVIQYVIDEHFPFDCNLIEIDPHTWAIHGSIPVGGETILAEFGTKHDAETALEMLSAAEQRTNGPQAPDSSTGVFPGLDR
jgi:hypothetical protein